MASWLLVEGEREVNLAPGSQRSVGHEAGTGHRNVGQHAVDALLGIREHPPRSRRVWVPAVESFASP